MGMKLGLINSAWFDSPVSTAEGIRKTKEIGFDTIDIFADPLALTPQERRTIFDTLHETGLPVVSVACVAVGLLDFNPAVARFNVERVKRHVDLAYELHGRNVLLVLGEYIWQQEVIPPRVQWQQAVRECQEIGDYAKDLGIEIALELEPFDLSLINTVDLMVQFLDDVNRPNVRANLDFSHLWLMRTPASDIQKLKGRIAHAHISDCNGETHGDLPPGRGNTPLQEYMNQLAQTGFDGTVSIELEYSPEPAKIVEWVQEAYAATAAIMRTAGVRG